MTDSTKCEVYGCPEPATANIRHRTHGEKHIPVHVCARHAAHFTQDLNWDLVDNIPHGIEIEP